MPQTRSKHVRTATVSIQRKPVPSRKEWKVALVGFGTVGKSVAKILSADPNSPFVLTYIFNRNIARKKRDGLPGRIEWTEDIEDVLSSDADIVIELIGGLDPAGKWIDRALLFASFPRTTLVPCPLANARPTRLHRPRY